VASTRRNPRLVPTVAGAAVALALVLVTATGGEAQAHHGQWHWNQQVVVVRDETGFADYRRAIGLAAARWNAAGAGVRLEVAGGRGRGCGDPERGEITVCRRSFAGNQAGSARVWLEGDHIVRGSVLMDTRPRPYEHLVAIACHELGHALGLDHRSERSSCLTATIHASDPDEHDRAELRRLHAHSHGTPGPAGTGSCGGHVLRLGESCVGSLEVLGSG
jgi:hypothetical protein